MKVLLFLYINLIEAGKTVQFLTFNHYKDFAQLIKNTFRLESLSI